MSPLSKAAAAQGPDARPTVMLRPRAEVPAPGPAWYDVVCETGDCAWTYGPALKTDALQHATWHRQAHRAKAVG